MPGQHLRTLNLQTFSKAGCLLVVRIFLVIGFWISPCFAPGPRECDVGMAAGALPGVAGGYAIAMIGVFENKSWIYFLINGGYMVLAFIVMGAIIGAWR